MHTLSQYASQTTRPETGQEKLLLEEDPVEMEDEDDVLEVDEVDEVDDVLELDELEDLLELEELLSEPGI